jgi:hypothetical protein
MSIFSGIESIEHTIACWAEKELNKLYGKVPKIEQVAGTILAYVGPALQIVATLEAGAPAGVIVEKVVQEAQSDLIAASGLVYDFGANPTIRGIIASVKTNLSALLVAGHITNPASIAGMNQVIGELGTLATAMGNTPTASPAPTPRPVSSPAPVVIDQPHLIQR